MKYPRSQENKVALTDEADEMLNEIRDLQASLGEAERNKKQCVALAIRDLHNKLFKTQRKPSRVRASSIANAYVASYKLATKSPRGNYNARAKMFARSTQRRVGDDTLLTFDDGSIGIYRSIVDEFNLFRDKD